jgi:DNA-binding PadR family transcriptional regulator
MVRDIGQSLSLWHRYREEKGSIMGRHHDHGHDHGHHEHGFGRGRRGWGHADGPRARRGDVKYFILEILEKGPRHGYDVITALEQKTGGRYRPSPGSVYPTLQLLEDGGFATSETVDGKRVYTITESGRKLLKDKAPEAETEQVEENDLRSVFFKLAEAVRQAASVTGAAEQVKLREILIGARREVYKVLAEAD